MSPRKGDLDPESLAADDRGFLLGDGLFETLRIYRGTPFRLAAHLERMAAGARVAEIECPAGLEARVHAFLRRGPSGSDPLSGDAMLRITLSRGRGGEFGGGGVEGGPTLALRLVPLEHPDPEVGSEGDSAPTGLHAMLEGRVHEESLTGAIKGIAFLERIVALRRARARGGDEALVRNSRGELIEGSASNLVAILADGTVVSPGPAQGALPGITRAVVLEEARRMGFDVVEQGLLPEQLGSVREVLLTSSIREVASVVRVEGRPIADGLPGPLGDRLRDAYRTVVERECTSTGGG